MPWFLRVLIPMLVLLVFGCDEKKTSPPASESKGTHPAAVSASVVDYPESVKGQWRAVRILVQDRVARKENVYTVDIGYGFKLWDSGVSVRVKNFVPAFLVSGRTVTSASNEPSNPAAQIEVTEDGRVIYDGWIFSLFPATHAATHPRFAISLVGQVAAKKSVDKKKEMSDKVAPDAHR